MMFCAKCNHETKIYGDGHLGTLISSPEQIIVLCPDCWRELVYLAERLRGWRESMSKLRPKAVV